MADHSHRSTYLSSPTSFLMLGLSGMNNSAGEASDNVGIPSGAQSTRDMDSCDDFSVSSSSISIDSSSSELCTSDEIKCLESDEELENLRPNYSSSLVLYWTKHKYTN